MTLAENTIVGSRRILSRMSNGKAYVYRCRCLHCGLVSWVRSDALARNAGCRGCSRRRGLGEEGRLRNVRICELNLAGESDRDIARMLGCNVKTVRAVLDRPAREVRT